MPEIKVAFFNHRRIVTPKPLIKAVKWGKYEIYKMRKYRFWSKEP